VRFYRGLPQLSKTTPQPVVEDAALSSAPAAFR